MSGKVSLPFDRSKVPAVLQPAYVTEFRRLVEAFGGGNTKGPIVKATACNASSGGRFDFDSETFVVDFPPRTHTHTPEIFDMRGRGEGKISPTLCADHPSRPSDYCPVVFQQNSRSEVRVVGEANGKGRPVAGAVTSEPGAQCQNYLLEMRAKVFAQNQIGEVRVGDKVGALNTNANANASGRNTPMILETGLAKASAKPLIFDEYNQTEAEKCYPLRTATGDGTPKVGLEYSVRRLTPRECERLQGFSDDHTKIPSGKKFSVNGARKQPWAADSPRYKAIGNSMAVPCMRWIGEGIQLAMQTELLGDLVGSENQIGRETRKEDGMAKKTVLKQKTKTTQKAERKPRTSAKKVAEALVAAAHAEQLQVIKENNEKMQELMKALTDLAKEATVYLAKKNGTLSEAVEVAALPTESVKAEAPISAAKAEEPVPAKRGRRTKAQIIADEAAAAAALESGTQAEAAASEVDPLASLGLPSKKTEPAPAKEKAKELTEAESLALLMSVTGDYVTHFGKPKGIDMARAHLAPFKASKITDLDHFQRLAFVKTLKAELAAMKA